MLPDGSINTGEMTSFNHYALGAVTQWLLTELAGLELTAPGGTALRVRPRMGHGFTSASVVRRLPLGTARTCWELNDRTLHVTIDVPVGATADIVLPGAPPETVGHGRHERTVTVPARAVDARGPILTVRDLLDDDAAWARVVKAVTGTHPLYSGDPTGTLTGMLATNLDATARIVPAAATMYGFIPGMEQAAQALTEVIDHVAPQAGALPEAQRRPLP